MKKIEWVVNMMYFQVFNWEVFTQKIFNYPFKKYYKNKEGIENIMFDEKGSVSLTTTTIIVSGLISLFYLFIFFMIVSILEIKVNKFIFGIILVLISQFTFYKLVEKKYLGYFKQFKKLPSKVIRQWSIITFLIVIFLIFLAGFGLYQIFRFNGELT